MNASLSNASKAVAQRPALVLILLGLAGFLVDFLVRPISLSALVLLLLAASPFVVRMLKAERQSVAPSASTNLPAPVAAPAPRPVAPAAAAAVAQQAKPRVARPPELERTASERPRAEVRPEPSAPARPAANRVPRFEEPGRSERPRTPNAPV